MRWNFQCLGNFIQRSDEMKKAMLALAGALAVSGASALTVYNTAGVGGVGGNDGNQDFAGMLGLDFTVNVAGLQVRELGAFNDDLNGIGTNITVGLYNLTLGAVVIAPISFNGATGNGTYLFISLSSPVALIQGHQYSVQAFGYNSTDENYNTNLVPANNGSGAQVTNPVQFSGGAGWLTNNNSRFGGATMGVGTTFPHASTFGAGTLVVTQVPEPGALALMLAGLATVGFVATRRRA